MASSSAVHRSGRPKDSTKREAIVIAARRMFASHPFEMVTMEAVATSAGVSKMTVYSHFHDKETLFEAIILATSDTMIGALPGPDQVGGLREQLITMGQAFLGVIIGSDICKMAHTLPGALRANPALAARFYAAGPGRVRAALVSIINSAVECRELQVDDSPQAADDLVSLWEGSMPAKIAFGLTDLSGPAEIKNRAIHGTDVFLRAYRT